MKQRKKIPASIAAKELFLSDRTCCVCRQRSKPVQLHHIDEDSSNNDPQNLAVLCFDCHRETQISGGFDRKLDAEQVILYREEWIRLVGRYRTSLDITSESDSKEDRPSSVNMATSIAEIYRENKEYYLLALHYDNIGNSELRDKYVDLAIKEGLSDRRVWLLRRRQQRPNLIPKDVVNRLMETFTERENLYDRACLNTDLRKYNEAVLDYMTNANKDIQAGNFFVAAIYLKGMMEDGLIDQLFFRALEKAKEEGDIWWQVRVLQELGWHKELEELLKSNSSKIENSDDLNLKALLAKSEGDYDKYSNIAKQIAKDSDINLS